MSVGKYYSSALNYLSPLFHQGSLGVGMSRWLLLSLSACYVHHGWHIPSRVFWEIFLDILCRRFHLIVVRIIISMLFVPKFLSISAQFLCMYCFGGPVCIGGYLVSPPPPPILYIFVGLAGLDLHICSCLQCGDSGGTDLLVQLRHYCTVHPL